MVEESLIIQQQVQNYSKAIENLINENNILIQKVMLIDVFAQEKSSMLQINEELKVEINRYSFCLPPRLKHELEATKQKCKFYESLRNSYI